MNRIRAMRWNKMVMKSLVAGLPLAVAVGLGAPRDAAAQYVAPPPPPPPPQGQYVAPPAPAPQTPYYAQPPSMPQPQYVAPAVAPPPPPPPDAYIATAQPEYYEGRPVYWYNGSWYYRDEHGAWNYYRTEPPYLRDRRAHPPEHRRYQYNR